MPADSTTHGHASDPSKSCVSHRVTMQTHEVIEAAVTEILAPTSPDELEHWIAEGDDAMSGSLSQTSEEVSVPKSFPKQDDVYRIVLTPERDLTRTARLHAGRSFSKSCRPLPPPPEEVLCITCPCTAPRTATIRPVCVPLASSGGSISCSPSWTKIGRYKQDSPDVSL